MRLMIGIKEAIAKAREYLQDILGPQRTAEVLLEEVRSQQIDGEEAWLITLSIPAPKHALSTSPLAALGGQTIDTRDYKNIAIRKSDGEFIQMTIRTLPKRVL